MNKEQITKILSKIKDTVGENNYKLALAITGHRTGKIKDIIMCSKDGELLLEYVEQLEQQCKKQKEVIDRKKYLLIEQGAELKELYSEIDKLQGRIDKAIEYAENSGYEISNAIIIDILKGDSNE